MLCLVGPLSGPWIGHELMEATRKKMVVDLPAKADVKWLVDMLPEEFKTKLVTLFFEVVEAAVEFLQSAPRVEQGHGQ